MKYTPLVNTLDLGIFIHNMRVEAAITDEYVIRIETAFNGVKTVRTADNLANTIARALRFVKAERGERARVTDAAGNIVARVLRDSGNAPYAVRATVAA